jgi:hypothetical protein
VVYIGEVFNLAVRVVDQKILSLPGTGPGITRGASSSLIKRIPRWGLAPPPSPPYVADLWGQNAHAHTHTHPYRDTHELQLWHNLSLTVTHECPGRDQITYGGN